MTALYETGCNSHCNDGRDCTETKQHCKTPWPFPTSLQRPTEKQVRIAEREIDKSRISNWPEALL